jgi:monofunctional biosynthetic peptidoglycan transglycosylase
MTSSGSRRKTVFRLVRWLIVAVVAVLLLPYLLTPLYRVADPVSTPMLARWVLGKRVDRTFVPLERIAPVLPRSVIASEDARFCSHHGIDWTELRSSIEDAEDITEARGGSTITQQTAKNLFLWPGRSFIRKGLEFPLAFWIDLVLPKRRVLEIYLNIAEWGPNGEFGVEAGSRNCRPVRRPCWRRCCPIRSGAAPKHRGPRSGASPAWSRPAPPDRAPSTRVWGLEKGSSLGGGVPL